jgi:hypothetical protein
MIVAVGGSASVGKSTAAVEVADMLHLDDVVHVDDLSLKVQAAGSAHFLDELDRPWLEPAETLTSRLVEWTSRLHPAIAVAVQSLGDGGVVEGEGVDPRVAWPVHVCPVYVIEPSREVLAETFARRSSAARFPALSAGEQRTVVEMNWRYGAWLRWQAEEARQPWVPSQPFDTLAPRIVEALG